MARVASTYVKAGGVAELLYGREAAVASAVGPAIAKLTRLGFRDIFARHIRWSGDYQIISLTGFKHVS